MFFVREHVGFSGGARHFGVRKKVRMGGTGGVDALEADCEAMSGRLLVVARSVRSQEVGGTA